MDQTSSPSRSASNCSKQIVSIARSDRWQAHQRLQELDVVCACLQDGRFQVEITSPIAAVQLWSVFQHLTRSRRQLANWLDHCWALPTAYKDSY